MHDMKRSAEDATLACVAGSTDSSPAKVAKQASAAGCTNADQTHTSEGVATAGDVQTVTTSSDFWKVQVEAAYH